MLARRDGAVKELAGALRVPPEEIAGRVTTLMEAGPCTPSLIPSAAQLPVGSLCSSTAGHHTYGSVPIICAPSGTHECRRTLNANAKPKA